MNESVMNTFPESSRVWVYTASRVLSQDEVTEIQPLIDAFTVKWTAHSMQLRATGWVEKGVFLILMVDESQTDASGCSIDSSVAFVRALGEKLDVDFFDRLTFTYVNEEGMPAQVHKNDLQKMVDDGHINESTIFYNTLVQNKGELVSKWQVPLAQSWHARMLN